jgi:uncharacterized protein involved in exopolysaccharide biosynthesis
MDRSAETGWIGVCRTTWRGRWLVIAVVLLTVGLGVVAASVLSKKYEANVLLSPVMEAPGSTPMGTLGAVASQLGGLSSLIGLQSANGSLKSVSLATLQSEMLTEQYIREHNLLPVLFSKLWDPRTRTWRVKDPTQVPTLWLANQYFKAAVRVVTDSPKTGLVTMTITWRDPKVAAQWANDLVRMTNDFLRDKAVRESARNIEFLQSQVAGTNVVALQQAIYDLMEAEIKKQMLARGSEEYALKVVDPATPPESASFPKRLYFAAAGLAAGLVLSIGFLLLRNAWRNA